MRSTIIAPVATSSMLSSHPRLLTGKIASTPSPSLTTSQTNAGVSGWLKNIPTDGPLSQDSLPPQLGLPGRGGMNSYERARVGAGGSRGPRGGDAVWGSRSGTASERSIGIGGDFPTAAEAANGKHLKDISAHLSMMITDEMITSQT